MSPYQVTPFYVKIDKRINSNEEVSNILQCSRTEAAPSDALVVYSEKSLGCCYASEELQSVYSTAPPDWADTRIWFDIKNSPKLICHTMKKPISNIKAIKE